ncbi:hypothetical protein NA56DRAFT_350505 [Hyaloscypha hepaticicola]|uniref:Uncharacterized protein n=1 Tax=Hyaloscypha hepaticicola TaxID=2082293 RepID=A0A2J6PMR6_9HELO|nr:hypothetical protein NA56DRAFT_350505 [Hyaloscypha hepaticicola]
MHFHKHHSTPEEAEAIAQKLIDKSHLDIDHDEAKLIAKGVGIFHSRFSDPTTHAERKASWKKEIEEIKQRKHLQHEHSFHSSGSTTDLLADPSAGAGEKLNENPSEASSAQDDQLADNSGPQTSGITTAEDAQDDSESQNTAGEVADESLAVDSEPRSPAADSPPQELPQSTETGQCPQNTPTKHTSTSSPVSNGSVMIKSTSQICDMIRQLEEEHFFDPRYIALLPEQLAKKLKEMGMSCATSSSMPDEKSSGAEKVAEEGENGVEDEANQEGEGEIKVSES